MTRGSRRRRRRPGLEAAGDRGATPLRAAAADPAGRRRRRRRRRQHRDENTCRLEDSFADPVDCWCLIISKRHHCFGYCDYIGPRGDRLTLMLLEYISGSTLEHAVQSGRLALGERILVAQQVAHYLVWLHQRKAMVWLDLKPDNIMLEPPATSSQPLRVRIIDQDSNEFLGRGRCYSSVCNMWSAPEVAHPCADQPVSAAADVFSFGCLLKFLFPQDGYYGKPGRAVVDLLRGVAYECLVDLPQKRWSSQAVSHIIDSVVLPRAAPLFNQ